MLIPKIPIIEILSIFADPIPVQNSKCFTTILISTYFCCFFLITHIDMPEMKQKGHAQNTT